MKKLHRMKPGNTGEKNFKKVKRHESKVRNYNALLIEFQKNLIKMTGERQSSKR